MSDYGISTTINKKPSTKIKQKKGLGLYLRNNWILYLFLVLPMLYFLIFKYAPMYGILVAFKDYNMFDGIMKSPWNNFATFKEIFGMADFYRAVRNTFLLNLLDVIFGFPAPIFLAIILSELKYRRFKKFSQTVLYMPHFLSWIIIGSISLQLFSAQTGIINIAVTALGFEPIKFLTNRFSWIATYTSLGIWQSVGWNTIIYLAAIAGINSELYEAAVVDGAGRLRKIWHITLPGIKPTIIILLILQLGRMVAIGFDRPIAMTNNLVIENSDVISTFVYRVGLQAFQFSIATAVGFFQSVVGMIFLVTTNYIAEKSGEQGIW